MTKEERITLFAALSAPLPEEAVERTDGRVTGRGYSTSGYKYQFVVDRFNVVLGVGGWRAHRQVSVRAVTTVKGRTAYEAVCEIRLELGEFDDGRFVPFAEVLGDGGHQSMTEGDARKGAYTNAFKKAAAFLGVGREAYAGTIDDDNTPAEDTPPPRESAARPPIAVLVPAPEPPMAQGTVEPTIRARLTSKQYGLLLSLARGDGRDERWLRDVAKRRFGIELPHLSRSQASELIGLLSSGTGSNGHAPEAG